MILKDSLTREWIDSVSRKYKADKILTEKAIRALVLLEGLAHSPLQFIFKGGTALMLLLPRPHRLSIDIDILVPPQACIIESVLNQICDEGCFSRFEIQERQQITQIPKSHYKLFYTSAVEGKESSILLDILYETNPYQQLEAVAINSIFVSGFMPYTKVQVPDINNILGDKLTAFAPTTIGVPYHKGNKSCGKEIIKQLYDIGNLFDFTNNITAVINCYRNIAEREIAYRGLECKIDEVLQDTMDTALSLCLRTNYGKGVFSVLQNGIKQVGNFIYSESYYIERAIISAAKAAYLSKLIEKGISEVHHYKPERQKELADAVIVEPLPTKFNKFKKSNIEAFYYWNEIQKLM